MTQGYMARSFDLLNVCDLDLIAQASSICDRLTVAVLSDEDVHERMGRPPVVPLVERLELLRHVRGVDEVIVHGGREDTQTKDRFTVFAVADEAWSNEHSGETVILTLQRETASRMLQEALRADPESSVA